LKTLLGIAGTGVMVRRGEREEKKGGKGYQFKGLKENYQEDGML